MASPVTAWSSVGLLRRTLTSTEYAVAMREYGQGSRPSMSEPASRSYKCGPARFGFLGDPRGLCIRTSTTGSRWRKPRRASRRRSTRRRLIADRRRGAHARGRLPTVVTSRSVVTAHEVEALLDASVGASPDPINVMNYLNWGVARAFGIVGGVRIEPELRALGYDPAAAYAVPRRRAVQEVEQRSGTPNTPASRRAYASTACPWR